MFQTPLASPSGQDIPKAMLPYWLLLDWTTQYHGVKNELRGILLGVLHHLRSQVHLAKIVYITTAPLHKFNLPVAADDRGEHCKCLGLRFVESQQMLSTLNTMLIPHICHFFYTGKVFGK